MLSMIKNLCKILLQIENKAQQNFNFYISHQIYLFATETLLACRDTVTKKRKDIENQLDQVYQSLFDESFLKKHVNDCDFISPSIVIYLLYFSCLFLDII